MDGEGYLPLELIASFQRVQNMTQDINLVIAAIKDSDMVELKGRVSYLKKSISTSLPNKFVVFRLVNPNEEKPGSLADPGLIWCACAPDY